VAAASEITDDQPTEPINNRPAYRLTRSLLLRGLGVAYLCAFGSLAAQIDGLIGSHGILPGAVYLDRVAQILGRGPSTFWQVPTLFWLDASDWALRGACWGGIALSVLLIGGILPGLCVTVLWVFYLSLTVVGQVFLGYQWDSLLLESGLLAMLLTPWGIRLSRAGPPAPFAIFLFRWLVFRLMLQSGVVKLTSGDPTWRDWTALDYHYYTQPLPTWSSWYMDQMPVWFQMLSMAFMYYAEIVAPCFVFGPRILRRIGFVSLVLLQLLIASTGNYGFFNVLSAVLCLSLLDDQDWVWLACDLCRIARKPVAVSQAGSPAPGLIRRVVVSVVGGVLLAVTAEQTIETLDPALPSWVMPVRVAIQVPSQMVADLLDPLRSANAYGLFRVMTRERPEITLEGSEDGSTWKPYRFRWKPGELDRAPRFATPHMPRLDWQMWFAALAGDCRAAPWFLIFEERLLAGTPEVLALLKENPFPERPPRYLRARLSRYTFTSWGSKDWWASEEVGLFCPMVEAPHNSR
jgi:hypothetical protein